MKPILILGLVLMYAILVGSQHLWNWLFRAKSDNMILLGILGMVSSLMLLILLIITTCKEYALTINH